MKNLHIILGLAAVTASASAQQLPNVGFEESWVKSYPWNSVFSELSLSDALAAMGTTTDELQPSGWIASNVLGIVSEKDGGGYGALGSTEVASRVDGYGSKYEGSRHLQGPHRRNEAYGRCHHG